MVKERPQGNVFEFERNPSTEHAFSTIHDTTIFGAFLHFLTFLEIERYFRSFNMLRVVNSVNWMHYKPLNSLNGTILAMDSPSGTIFQLVLIYICPGIAQHNMRRIPGHLANSVNRTYCSHLLLFAEHLH